MSKLFWNILKVTPAILGASFLVGNSSIASAQSLPTRETNADQSNSAALDLIKQRQSLKQFNDFTQADSMSQVTNVSELRDVAPTAWAYEALRSLVERYGCIVGYPDRTFRGDRALSRWEFAAGLNACMNTMERLIQENVAVLKDDIEKLKRLAKEFEAELAALGARVDNLEARVSFLEDHQFSTTTKLKGEVIFSVADSFGDRANFNDGNSNNNGNSDDESQVAFNNRVRLSFETSFTGKDMLRTRLQAGNFDTTFNQRGVTGTNMTRLSYDDGAGNNVTLDDIFYRFPVGDKVTAWVGANSLDLDDVFTTVNPYMSDSGTGSLSRLGRYNVFVNRGPAGTGAAVKYKFSDQFYATATYLAEKNQASNPNEGNGLFNGSFSTGAQIGFIPTKELEIAVAYVRSYRTAGSGGLFGGVSSDDAEFPFGRNVATTADRVGLQASWQVAKTVNIAAWGGYASANAPGTGEDSVDIWTWNANVSFLDLGKEGAVLSLAGGMPPKGDREDTSYLIQAQYKYPLTDNISLTPGAYVVLNPNNDDNNDTIWMGVLRTTYKF